MYVISMPTHGTLFILTAPSGAGKTTLAEGLTHTLDNIERSVSYTTRPIRPGEKTGIHYQFVDEPTFQSMVAKNIFLEHALVHGYHYGTSCHDVDKSLQAGIDVILAIDWQGAQQVRQQVPEAVSIFILPPSKHLLQQRLHARGQDDTQVIERRLAVAASEIAHHGEFDYLVINDDLAQALQDLQAIVRSKRLACEKQTMRHSKLLAEWLGKR